MKDAVQDFRKRAEQVRDVRSGGQGGQTERLETAPASDRRQDRVDEGHRDPDADAGNQIQGEIPPDRAS